MILAPRLPSIASGSSDSAVLSEWGEFEKATTRMVEEESKLGTASSSVATPESEWESSVGRSEGALVAETIAGTMLMVWGVLANLAVLMITDWR